MRYRSRSKKPASPVTSLIVGIAFVLIGILMMYLAFHSKEVSDEFMKDAIPVTVKFTKVWTERKSSGTGRHRHTTTHHYAKGYYIYEDVSYPVNKVSTNSSARVGGTMTVYIHADRPSVWRKQYTQGELVTNLAIGAVLAVMGVITALMSIKQIKEKRSSGVMNFGTSRSDRTFGSGYDGSYGRGAFSSGSTYGSGDSFGGGGTYGSGVTYGSGSTYGGGSSSYGSSRGDSYGGHYSSTDFYTGYYDENDTNPDHVNY